MTRSPRQQQTTQLSPQQASRSPFSKALKHRLTKPKTKASVFITNMSEINNIETFPAIKTVVSEEWKERSLPQEHNAFSKPGYVQGRDYRNHPIPTFAHAHAPPPFAGPPGAYFHHHGRPAVGRPGPPPNFPSGRPFQYGAPAPPPRPPYPPPSYNNSGVFRVPHRGGCSAASRNGSRRGPMPSILRKSSYDHDTRAPIRPSLSYPMPARHDGMRQIRQTSSACEEADRRCSTRTEGNVLLLDPSSSPKRRKVVEEIAVEVQEGEDVTSKTHFLQMKLPPRPSQTVASPKPYNKKDIRGKQLVLTVSASPTGSCAESRQHQVERNSVHPRNESLKTEEEIESATFPDSPGQAFFESMEGDDDDDFILDNGSPHHESHSSLGSFNLLPLLDAGSVEGQGRTSPPLMPFLSKSPHPSWEMAESNDSEHDNAPDGYSGNNSKLPL